MFQKKSSKAQSSTMTGYYIPIEVLVIHPLSSIVCFDWCMSIMGQVRNCKAAEFFLFVFFYVTHFDLHIFVLWNFSSETFPNIDITLQQLKKTIETRINRIYLKFRKIQMQFLENGLWNSILFENVLAFNNENWKFSHSEAHYPYRHIFAKLMLIFSVVFDGSRFQTILKILSLM